MELLVDAGDVSLPATLEMPLGDIRGGVVPLHGAAAGNRSYVLYEHLALTLPKIGVAVLRYDRRPDPDGRDVPLATQAADARCALQTLGAHAGDVPLGLWGFSQGAWAAPLVAADHPDDVAFLVAVSASGVSPAIQMRYGTAEQVRRAGYDDEAVRELAGARQAIEDFLRGDRSRADAQAVIDLFAGRPWFPLAYLPPELSMEPGAWADMDLDPEPIFARVTCPVLAFYGATDEWVPIEESVATWQRAQKVSGTDLTVMRVPGCGHTPMLEDRSDVESVSDAYTSGLLTWLDRTL